MAQTNFKIFNEEMNPDRTFSDSEYEVATQRQTGVIPGMALSRLHNKMYRQSSAMAKAIADLLVAQGLDCMDNDLPAITTGLQTAILNIASDIQIDYNNLINKPNLTQLALNIWKTGKPYAVGDVCFSSSDGNSYKRFECISAGTTGETEPTWPAVGQTVTDGTATWKVVNVTTIPSIQGLFKNLKSQVTSNTQATITVDQVVLFSALNIPFLASNINVVADITINGVNGLDTGAKANNTWYAVWLISNGSNVSALLSANGASPTMPNGYIYKARIGWLRVGSDGNFMRTLQLGNKVQYVVTPSTNTSSIPAMANTSTAVSTWTAIAVSQFVPPTASTIKGNIACNTGSSSQFSYLAPNQSYSANGNCTYMVTGFTGNGVSNNPFDILLESTNIYWLVTGGSAVVNCAGWEDNL